MEVYALLALGGFGLYFARKQYASFEGYPKTPPPPILNNIPVNNVYESTYVDTAKAREVKLASAMATLASLPLGDQGGQGGQGGQGDQGGQGGQGKQGQGQVIPQWSNRIPEVPRPEKEKTIRSQLSGLEIPVEHFTHTNMQPFYRGDLKQNLNPNANSTLLENITGNEGFYHPPGGKNAQGPLFEATAQHIFGTQIDTQSQQDRIVKPVSRKNDFPIPQIRVGPGIDQGFTSQPSDGYYSQREFAMPRGTDEIRVASNPKTTYDGRVLPPQKGKTQPGPIGDVNKYRPETTIERPMDYYQPTTGAFLKEQSRPEIIDRPQTREDTAKEYHGPGYAANKRTTDRPDIQDPRTQNLEAFSVGPVTSSRGQGARDDMGKSSIQIYANGRDVTTTKVYQGNVSSMVKALTAPLLDIMKPNKAACPSIVFNPREGGNIHGPSRTRIYDPDDVARTTLKEGLVDQSQVNNFAGPVRPPVYTSDVMRTTIKETTLDTELNNLKGPVRSVIYDPSDVMRTTIKETTLDTELNNLKGPVRSVIYDPNDIARTTVRETLIEEAQGANIAAHTHRGQVYLDEEARTTTRETLDEQDGGSIQLSVPGTIARDPNDVARNTLKETLVDAERDFNNPNALERRRGAYTTTEYDARQTQKETLSDGDYYGHARRDVGEGYSTAPTDLRPSDKAQLSDGDYYGVAQSQSSKPTSHEEYENAKTNDTRELMLEDREPTATGVKVSAGSDEAGLFEDKRQIYSQDDYRVARAVNSQAHLDSSQGEVTHERQSWSYDNYEALRLRDLALGSRAQLDDNPLNIRINDSVILDPIERDERDGSF